MGTRRTNGLLCTAILLIGSGCKAPSPPNNDAPAPAQVPLNAQRGNDQESVSSKNLVPLEKKTFGAAITETRTTSLTDLATEPSKFGGKMVKTEGMVTAVCKAMGCWMEIGDASGTAHIRMAGHAFFVPKTASGHRAQVQGTVEAAKNDNACKDGCGPDQVAKVEIQATGVEFID